MSPGGGAHGFIKGERVMGLDWGDRRCGERFAFFLMKTTIVREFGGPTCLPTSHSVSGVPQRLN